MADNLQLAAWTLPLTAKADPTGELPLPVGKVQQTHYRRLITVFTAGSLDTATVSQDRANWSGTASAIMQSLTGITDG